MNQIWSVPRSSGQRRAAKLDNPRFEWARTPRMRRRLVIAMAVIIALEVAMLLAAGALADYRIDSFASKAVLGLFFAGFGLLLVAFVVCFGILKASTRGVEDDGLGPDQLDERQMQVRGMVYEQAYKIGAGLVTILLVAGGAWSAMTDSYPPSLVIIAVMLVTFHVTIVLPTLVAAWHKQV